MNSTPSPDRSNPAENVDPEEIKKFESLAERWWDPESEFRPLHEINPLRLDYINTRAPLNNKRVIDIGCGGGLLSEAMAQHGADVTGIDMGELPIRIAQQHAEQANVSVRYLVTTAEAIAADEPQGYDIVTCLEMLEHVPDPSSVINACAQLVKPDGHVFFSTINRNAKAYLFAVVGAEYVLNLLPKGTHEYNKFIRPSELEHWARKSGLALKHLTGMHYNPLSKIYSLGDGVDVNYLMHCTRPNDSQ